MPGTAFGLGSYGSGTYGILEELPPVFELAAAEPADAAIAGVLGNRLYELLAPLAYADAEHDFALLKLCEALIGRGQELEDLVRDTDEGPGWSALVDPDRAPEKALGFVAQLVGVRLRPGLSDEAQRLRIKETAGMQRGSPGALRGAAAQYLSGNRTVFLTERHGSPYRLTVTTYEFETPTDTAALVEALLEQKPAGIVLTHSVVPGGDFETLRDTHSDFADIASTFSDFADIRADPAQQ